MHEQESWLVSNLFVNGKIFCGGKFFHHKYPLNSASATVTTILHGIVMRCA